MNEPGLHLKWVFGKCNTDVHFISVNEIIFGCGSCLKSCRTDVNEETAIEGPDAGIHCITADPSQQLIAVSDLDQQTSIYVIDFQSFQVLSQLKCNVHCEYSSLNFARKDLIFALEAYPNYVVTLFNWKKRQQLKEISYPFHSPPTFSTKFTVHPAHDELSFFQQGIAMHFFNIEDVFQNMELKTHTVFMPKIGDIDSVSILTLEEVRNLTWFDKFLYDSWGIHSKNMKDLTLHSLCEGMSDIELVQFFDEISRQERLVISCHCWLPDKDIIVACTNGCVLIYSFKGLFKKYLKFSDIKSANVYFEDVITCMALSSMGLFITIHNGDVLLVSDIDKWTPIKKFSLPYVPFSVKFSPNFFEFVVVIQNKSIWSSNIDFVEKVQCLVPEISDDKPIIGICIIDNSYIVRAKENGLIEALDIANRKQILSVFDIEENIKVMEVNSCSVIFIATTKGNLYVLNSIDIKNLHIIQKLRLCDLPLESICIENLGKFALLKSYDKIFLIGIFPSIEITILGYFMFNCVVKSMCIFTKDLETLSSIFLLCQPLNESSNDSNYLLTLQIPKDFDSNFDKYWEDESGILDPNYFVMEKVDLDYPSSNIIVHHYYGVIISNIVKSEIQNIHINFYNNFPEKLPKLCFESPKEIFQIVISPSHNIFMVLLKSGEIYMLCLENPNYRFKIESSFTNKEKLRFVTCFSDDDYVLVANNLGFIKCYDISYLKIKFAKAWEKKYQQKILNKINVLSEKESIVVQDYATPWLNSMTNKLNTNTLHSIETQLEKFSCAILKLSNALDFLISENKKIPTKHQIPIEDLILDETLRESLLIEREQILKDYEYSLSQKLSSYVNINSDMENKFVNELEETCKIIKPLKKGQVVYNYSFPKLSEVDIERMNYAYKVTQINKCLDDLNAERALDLSSEYLYFDENSHEKDIVNIFDCFKRDIFLLQSQEEKVNYTYILQYIIFRKMSAFNNLFKKLLHFKTETLTAMKSSRSKIFDIQKQIEYEQIIWVPEEESSDSHFQVTEQEIEKKSPFKSEEYSSELKGLADYFLETEWFFKLSNPTTKGNQAKLRPDVFKKLQNELGKLITNYNLIIDEYENRHNALLENKLESDVQIIFEELQIFFMFLGNDNISLLNKLKLSHQKRICQLSALISNTGKQILRVEEGIEKSINISKDIFSKINETQKVVENLSKASRNKTFFLEEFKKRPEIKKNLKSNNPYEINFLGGIGSFHDLNNLKPKKIPVNIWKEMCIHRENISVLENDLKQNEIQTERLIRTKTTLTCLQKNLESKIFHVSNYLDNIHTQQIQPTLEVPMAIEIDYSQLEMQYPDNLNFLNTLFIRKFPLESLNQLLSGVGGVKLDLVQKQAKYKFQIEKNTTGVGKASLDLKNLRYDMETVRTLPMGKELQNLLQDPESGLIPGTKIQTLEKSASQERAEIERQMKQVDENASRIRQKMGNLRRGMRQRLEEIEALKGNLDELRKLGDEK